MGGVWRAVDRMSGVGVCCSRPGSRMVVRGVVAVVVVLAVVVWSGEWGWGGMGKIAAG